MLRVMLAMDPGRPEVAASKLMSDPVVRAAYDQRREQLAREAGVEGIRVLHELATIAYDKEVPKMARIKGIKALELLGKNLKLWTERHEHTGPGGKPLAPPAFSIYPLPQLASAAVMTKSPRSARGPALFKKIRKFT
jgi:hypothetical protein